MRAAVGIPTGTRSRQARKLWVPTPTFAVVRRADFRSNDGRKKLVNRPVNRIVAEPLCGLSFLAISTDPLYLIITAIQLFARV